MINAFKVSEMSSISTLEVAWENRWLWPSSGTKEFSAVELLKRINSSCSSGYEEKQCEWDYVPINVAAQKGNLEMVKYCVKVLRCK